MSLKSISELTAIVYDILLRLFFEHSKFGLINFQYLLKTKVSSNKNLRLLINIIIGLVLLNFRKLLILSLYIRRK